MIKDGSLKDNKKEKLIIETPFLYQLGKHGDNHNHSMIIIAETFE